VDGESAVEDERNGGEWEGREESGGGGGGVKVVALSVSYFRMYSRDCGSSHGGGRMLALRCRLRRRASQRGRGAW